MSELELPEVHTCHNPAFGGCLPCLKLQLSLTQAALTAAQAAPNERHFCDIDMIRQRDRALAERDAAREFGIQCALESGVVGGADRIHAAAKRYSWITADNRVRQQYSYWSCYDQDEDGDED